MDDSHWFAGTGMAGWVIVALAAVMLAGGIVAAVLRVSRRTAILLLFGCQLPLFAGIAGMMIGRSNVDAYMASHPEATAADRELGEEESLRCLYLGLSAMLICDTAAAVALVRARPPEGPLQPPA